ncbi:MAG: cobalamin biosynthesis protein [Synergistaceae bacterium]|nr:cobalamin biosynthesis protein [Synergistaceae bacterium]
MSMFSIVIALVLDFVLGDPAWKWHPVRAFGRMIPRVEKYCRTFPISPRTQGVMFLVMNMSICLVPVLALSFAAPFMGPLRHVVWGGMLYFALGGTCLAREVEGLCTAMSREGLTAGRQKLRLLVSRDVDGMNETAIVSSAIETLSENFSDSAVATLLYAALGGPVLAWAHRASNTLDAMVGYKNERYAEFGRASAMLDDAFNFAPARVSAFLTACASGSVARAEAVWDACFRWGRALASPNSGYPIAAFAGALGVTLCGPVRYFGVMKEKPYIGNGPRPTILDMSGALSLYWNSLALASAMSLVLARLIHG